MKHKAGLSISRPNYGDGRKKINIRVTDKDSRIQFLEIEINLDIFAECLTGLAECECEFEVRGLENVGKKIEKERFEFELPKPRYYLTKDDIIKLAETFVPDGWHCSKYFGSKDSFFSRDGKNFAQTTISRWVDKQD